MGREGDVRRGCFMSSWPFNVYTDRVMKEMKMLIMRMGGGENDDFLAFFMQMIYYYGVNPKGISK